MANVVILTRGDEQWGLGHLHRVSWLSEALTAQRDRCLSVAVASLDSTPARAFWSAHKVPVVYLEPGFDRNGDLTSVGLDPDVVIIDWLDSAPGFVKQFRELGCRLVLLDDYGPAGEHADLVINSLLAPVTGQGPLSARSHVYSGIKYVQLAPEISKLRNVATSTTNAMAASLSRPIQGTDKVKALFASFGGAAKPEILSVILESLVAVGYTERVITIPAPPPPFRVPRGLDVELHPGGGDFRHLLAAADLAVLGGGISLYEAACLGIPALAVAVTSSTPGHEKHQLDTILKLTKEGCCISLGGCEELDRAYIESQLDAILLDTGRRRSMTRAGMQLVDGQGLDRTMELILSYIN